MQNDSWMGQFNGFLVKSTSEMNNDKITQFDDNEFDNEFNTNFNVDFNFNDTPTKKLLTNPNNNVPYFCINE